MKNLVLISSVLLILISSCRKHNDDPPVINSTFEKIWEKNYGGSGTDRLYSMVPTITGGYVLAGSTSSKDGDLAGINTSVETAPWLINVDSNGNKLWSKIISIRSAEAEKITPSVDGGYFVAGRVINSLTTYYDVWYSKIDANGDTLWCKYLTGQKGDYVSSIIATADGGAIISGTSESKDGDFVNNPNPGPEFSSWITKINSNGTIAWLKWTDAGTSIIPAFNGGYVMISGSTLIKKDENGNTVWKKELGSNPTYVYSTVIKTKDGGYIAAGNSPIKYDRYGYPLPDGDVTVVKADGDGNTIWEKKYGGSQKDIGLAIANAENGYIVSSLTYSDDGDVAKNPGFINSWLFKINDNGNIVWSHFMGTGYAGFYSIIPLPGNHFVAGGETSINENSQRGKEGWMIKFKDQPL